MIEGDPVAPFDIEAKLRRQLTLLDTPGLVGLALAGIDMAAWDALARAQRVPLVVLLGGASTPSPHTTARASGSSPSTTLADEAEALVAEGFTRDQAPARARRFRRGPGRGARGEAARRRSHATVMCDFNQRLTVSEAIRRARALDGEGLYWIEEPIRHDDYEGYARIAAEAATPIQTGENLVDTFEMARAIALQSLDFVMPDVQRIGGVTGWLRAAALAHAHGIEMSSHLFPEFSVHLLGVTPTCHWLEFMDWAAPLAPGAAPRARTATSQIPDRPGRRHRVERGRGEALRRLASTLWRRLHAGARWTERHSAGGEPHDPACRCRLLNTECEQRAIAGCPDQADQPVGIPGASTTVSKKLGNSWGTLAASGYAHPHECPRRTVSRVC